MIKDSNVFNAPQASGSRGFFSASGQQFCSVFPLARLFAEQGSRLFGGLFILRNTKSCITV